jgi:hypothetical protein
LTARVEVEVSVDASELDTVDDGPLTATIGGQRLTIRFPTSVDVAAMIGCETVERACLELARRCVETGEEALADDDLLAAVEAELNTRASASAMSVGVSCPDCVASWSSELDIGSFLWAELEILAKQLLSDVDVIARSYGWSEAEILALSGARRSFYLDRCLTADGG